MKTTKMNLGALLLTATLAVTIVSCKKEGCTDASALNYNEKAKKDDGSCNYSSDQPGATSNVIVSGQLTENTTWSASNVYELAGKVVVGDGVTLTIEAGTIIKGREGNGTLASALVIARGGKLMANGTASAPIIFTSVLDNIKVGEITGTNLTENDYGLWGGVIILGRAPISALNGNDVSQIEGIPTSDSFGAYGGTDNADNSGVLNYISIRHGGALIGEGNEINGLTLGGVGSGTSISNIEVIGNLDDGIEFFGGSVNVSNILIGFQGDDGLDVDQSYSGTISNFLVINHPSFSDKALEVDGTEGTSNLGGMVHFVDGSCIVYGTANYAPVDFKDKAQGTVTNVKMGNVKLRASYKNECAEVKTDAISNLLASTPKLTFTGCQFPSIQIYTSSKNTLDADCPIQAGDNTAATAAMVSVTAIGGTANYAWTWASKKGKI